MCVFIGLCVNLLILGACLKREAHRKHLSVVDETLLMTALVHVISGLSVEHRASGLERILTDDLLRLDMVGLFLLFSPLFFYFLFIHYFLNFLSF